MIRIREIQKRHENEKLIVFSNLDIDGKDFELRVVIYDKEYHQYAVTDRADAFLWAVLPYAMRHGHDIVCDNEVTGKFLFNLETQYITTIAKGDKNFYAPKITAKTTDAPCEVGTAVATGLSCGVDCLYSVIEAYKNKTSPNLALTHFCVFNQGAFGGSYYSSNRDFAVKKLFEKEKALADELGLPIIELANNLESLMKIPYDQFIVYSMGMLILTISKLIGVYHYSSSGGDYGDFSVENLSKRDISYADLLNLSCLSFGSTYFYSAGGAKTRFEKMQTIANHHLTKKHLFSCLNYTFNCGVCPKCYRNLLTLDALGLLDEYRNIFDIDAYKKNRNKALEYLVGEVVSHGYSYAYLIDVYNAIKEREPQTIAAIENGLNFSKAISERNSYKSLAVIRRCIIRAYKTLALDAEVQKAKNWFVSKNIKNVILYSYSGATDIIVNYNQKFGISIDYIVEDVKEKRMIPRLPVSTVEYPKTDAIIICDISNPEIVMKKLKERTNIPCYYASEFLDLRDAF